MRSFYPILSKKSTPTLCFEFMLNDPTRSEQIVVSCLDLVGLFFTYSNLKRLLDISMDQVTALRSRMVMDFIKRVNKGMYLKIGTSTKKITSDSKCSDDLKAFVARMPTYSRCGKGHELQNNSLESKEFLPEFVDSLFVQLLVRRIFFVNTRQTNHKAKALWFELFKGKLRIRISKEILR